MALTRQSIVGAAIDLIDREGVRSLSMRNLAKAMGVGTMSLYHYVHTREELLEFVDDALMGEQLMTNEGDLSSADWRSALTAIATQSAKAFRRHPWRLATLGGVTHRGALGPNGLRHLEQSLAAAASTGLSLKDRLYVVQLVDNFVIGHVLRTAAAADGDAGAFPEQLQAQLAEGDYPLLSELVASESATEGGIFAIDDEAAFARGLRLLLDGINDYLERQTR